MLIRVIRLRHLASLGKSRQEVLWQALCEEAEASGNAWLRTAEQDVQWLDCTLVSLKHFMPYCTAEAFDEASVERAHVVRKHLAYAQSHIRMSTTAESVPRVERLPATANDFLFLCDHCPARFSSKQRLCAHSWAAHAARPLVESYLGSSTCPACLVNFWSRERLIQHVVRDSHVCRWGIMSNPLPEHSEVALCREQASRR